MLWFILISVFLVAVGECTGVKSCVIWSSAGHVVQLGQSFQVYCTFIIKECKLSMKDHSSSGKRHKTFNGTTNYFHVSNITNIRTYSCECENLPATEPCGLDIYTGYPPDVPTNISCIYEIRQDGDGAVICTWNRGYDTRLKNTSLLWVKMKSGNNSDEPVMHKVSNKGSKVQAVSFTVPRSVQFISVWAQTQNPLGDRNSSIVNYTLSEIVMPSTPSVSQPNCSSRTCIIQLVLPVSAATLEVQYRAQQDTWTTFTDAVVPPTSSRVSSIHPLEPYTLYDFRVRCKFNTGLWSQWSDSVSSWTQEEAPAKQPDVWFTQSEADFRSLRIYWKDADPSIFKGKITEYVINVTPYLNNSVVSAKERNYSVPVCAKCEVTVWARNSKGLSPPAKINTRPSKGKPPSNVQVTINSSVTISWRRPDTAPPPTDYVLEWYPKGQQLSQLRWLTLGIEDTRSALSDIKPFECYDGAVYAIYKDNTVSGRSFTDVAMSESVPTAAPQLQETVNGNTVKIRWPEIHRSLRGGCIVNYTIYVKSDREQQMIYSVPSTQRRLTIQDLSPGVYSLWMSASTAKGEGPLSQKIKIFVEQKTPLSILLPCVFIAAVGVLLPCLCQISAVKHRFYKFSHRFMLDVVPDPANSKWAKECNQDKGTMNLLVQLRNCSMEEDPVLVDVEELHKQDVVTYAQTNISSQLSPQSSTSTELTPPFPLASYIKSFSQDSNSSENTQASMDTTMTVDYITTHGSLSTEEEYEVEEEEEGIDMQFLPSHMVFGEPMGNGGRLTLDAVRIDCSNILKDS